MSQNILLSSLVTVERAVDDLRRGMPVVLEEKGKKRLVLATEEASLDSLSMLRNAKNQYVILTGKRAAYLFQQPEVQGAARIALEDIPAQGEKLISLLHHLCGATQLAEKEEILPFFTPIPAKTIDNTALALVKIAELLPSAIVAEYEPGGIDGLVTVQSDAIYSYKETAALSLKRACEAPLCLKGAEDTRIVAYRPSIGGREHYAIIIGNPEKDKAPLVRVHSSCYTGDLLGSLTCDCGDQLRAAITLMGEKASQGGEYSGGIIVYLMQEGRGIGLTNKLRTYALQARGYDTVDANEILGFDDDERLFQLAAEILRDLGHSHIQLLTNNPKKARGMEEFGIQVIGCVPHIIPPHQHNDAYLKTKAARLGHVFKSSAE